MSRFKAKVTEVSIYMDEDMFITTISAPDKGLGATHDEAQLGDFHMSLFTTKEWEELNKLIANAIEMVTESNWESITGHSIFGGDKAEGRTMYLSPDEVREFARAIEAKLKEKNT